MLRDSTWELSCDTAPVLLCPISQTSLLCHQGLLSELEKQLEEREGKVREEGGWRLRVREKGR